MLITSICNIFTKKNNIADIITIRGWIRSRRDSKSGISFLNVYDGSIIKTIQVIAKKNLSNYYNEIIKLTIGCSIIIKGYLKFSPGKLQKYEILAENIQVIGWINNPASYPMSAKNHTLEYIRNFCHLRIRTNLFGSISRIRNIVFHALHRFLYQKKYFWIATPIITSINAEGAGSMFKVSMLDYKNIEHNKIHNLNKRKDFFDNNVYLTVSGQLTLEAYACALSKVYSFGPTFRAENSNTTRHLAEFWMLEIEKAFANIDDISKLSENLLKFVIKTVLNECNDDLIYLQKYIDPNILIRLDSFIKKPFITIEYIDAIKILQNNICNNNEEIFWGKDLSSNQEKYLVEKYFHSPVIIKNYPKSLKAFYMRLNKDNRTVSAIDVLLPLVGEIIGGSEREERLLFLKNRMNEEGLNEKNYLWYQDLRKYGTVPHSGFGLGFERLIIYITGVKNIRDVIPFPRTVGHANF